MNNGLIRHPSGYLYCPMSGHAERACSGMGTQRHREFIAAGIGVSTVPGPTDAELRQEIATDFELLHDEFHRGDPPGIDGEMYGS